MDSPGMRRRILVVDDDEQSRAIVCNRLQAMGFDVVGEQDGRAGLARIATDTDRTPIHGVLLDLHTPSPDGMAMLREIRDRHPEIPVIMMSTAADLDRLRAAITLGAGEYLVKPFDQDLFAKKCRRIFLGHDDPA
jgi:DNA-binding NtrC family response regulator